MVKVNIWILAIILVAIVTVLLFWDQITGYLFPSQDKKIIGNFFIDEKSEVCKELNRSIVYLFGSTSCPHCLWEDPIIKNVTSNFVGLISFHENIDIQRDMDIFSKYSPGGYIPLIVIGCKYYRVGSGETLGAEQDTRVLTALICSLTNKQPPSVCSGVEDMINQIGV
jgi:thiol-disulfide isomerase/thioredoxin